MFENIYFDVLYASIYTLWIQHIGPSSVTKYQLATVIFVNILLEDIKLNYFAAGCISIKPTPETLEGLKIKLFK